MRRTSLAAAVVAIIVLIGGCGPGAPDVNATGSNMSKIQGELLMVATDDMRKRKLRDKEVLNAKGAEFAGAAMKAEILDSSLLSALVIPGTSDKAAPDLAGYTAAN
ncbi:MAG: hypothetical protein KDB07_04855 [Planctomycetes bacterium]|nr:hypothetical protein [Planctomycetota bacterium]